MRLFLKVFVCAVHFVVISTVIGGFMFGVDPWMFMMLLLCFFSLHRPKSVSWMKKMVLTSPKNMHQDHQHDV